MHFLVMFLGILAAGAFWWYRLKMIRDAGSEVADAIGRAQGKYRRGKIRKANAESPIAAIDDPVTACATLIYCLLENPETVAAQDQAVQDELQQLTDTTRAHEASVYGRWAAMQGVSERTAIKMLCGKLDGWLSTDERGDVVSIIEKLESSDLFAFAEMRTAQAVSKLQEN